MSSADETARLEDLEAFESAHVTDEAMTEMDLC